MLQESLAPDSLPEADGVTLEAVYFPAALKHSVGGDWYDVFELSGGRLMCIIGDVAGHGLDAAIVMNHARQRLAAAAIIAEDPSHVLQLANAHLHGTMVTVLCCVLDTNTRSFTYASAGHPPPIIVAQHHQVQMLSYGGPPLGIFPTIDVYSQSHILEEGSCVYLFTDGLIEHHRDAIQGETDLLQQAALAASHKKPALSLYQSIIPSGEPRDDVAILSIKMK
jgi:serine phosphatase RsbU (regulator of sigma subunit)